MLLCSTLTPIFLSLLLDDIWPKNERQEEDSEPEWVQSEREQFHQHRDTNKDGKLDKVRQEEERNNKREEKEAKEYDGSDGFIL